MSANSFGNISTCTLANIFGGPMDTDSADPYMGLTWLTFRDRKHSLKKMVLKFRPSGVDLNGGH